ncbi:hypothetical protein HG15A2_04920 [Adhaeretor mobilis]|uniref:PEP-CTERM protein-sorting domain-containing protein n=1 Tax=Adhaeretor mobilis TaxID=1930276 RepID=A0A517MQS0_9BACT|nr:hypothetical protein HG15A2_04920 [Adhaeretor mobilis]
MVALFAVPRASAIDIVLDYSIDEANEGWFSGSPEGLARRASVNSAASFLSAIITNDNWDAISVFNKDLSFTDIAASSLNDLNGNPVAGLPESDGAGFSYNFDLTNLSSVGANEYVIYVGAFEFDSGTSSHAKAGWDSSDRRNAAGNAGMEFNTWGGKMYFDTGDTWYTGQNPGIDPTDDYGIQDPNKMPTSDITSDNWDWHTSLHVWKGFELDSIDPAAVNQSDLYATALHEMLHALGATSSNMSTYVGVSGNTLIGSNLVAEYGGPVPKSSTGHFANDVQSEVWDSNGIISEVTLDPNSLDATRKYLTKLDAALLRDLGYQVLDTFVTAPTADFDNSGVVDIADLDKWNADFGGPGSDANGDDFSDGADLLLWQQQFGDGSVVANSSSVPEPTSLLLLVGLLSAFLRRQR